MHKLFLYINMFYACLPTFIQFKEKFGFSSRIKQIIDKGFQNKKIEQNILQSLKSQHNKTQIRKIKCVMNLQKHNVKSDFIQTK